MGLYAYQAKTLDGKLVKGEVDANSEVEARVKIRAQRVIPIKVVVKGAARSQGSTDLMTMFGIQPTVKTKDLQVFTRQFATMISSGIPIVQCLDILYHQSTSAPLRETVMKVKANVESGKRLAESLDGFPRVFDRLYVSLVRAGEEAGALDTILSRLAGYIEKAVKLKNKVKGAMWYPVGVLIFSLIIITGLLIFVVPKFEKLFKGVGQELPGPTILVIELSHIVQNYFLYLLVATVLGITLLVRYYNTAEGRRTIDSFVIGIPIFGAVIQKGAIARFSRTFSTMLSCGVGILESLEISARVVGNAVIESSVLRARAGISEGKSITTPLLREKYIPPMLVQMMGVGEATGRLDAMLAKVADFYEEEVDYAVDSMTSILEPLMMVILGGLIAVLVLAMYLPVFNLAGAVG